MDRQEYIFLTTKLNKATDETRRIRSINLQPYSQGSRNVLLLRCKRIYLLGPTVSI